MAEDADPRLRRFRDEFLPLIVRRFEPERVIAFGSRARGEALESSDLDLLIVARAFDGIRWLDRQVEVQEAIGAPFAMDILCYTPEEFSEKVRELGIVRTAAETGLELHRRREGGGAPPEELRAGS